MMMIFFSTNMNLAQEWQSKTLVKYRTLICDDVSALDKELKTNPQAVILSDYDSVASDINKFISSNTLPKNLVVLERVPEIATGKMVMSHGVKAYGNSRMLKNNFQQMIKTVIEGKIWTYPELMTALVKMKESTLINDDAARLIENRLTKKEIKVVHLILEGFTNDAIASELEITQRTVKAHISSIFTKLHVNDRLSLVLLLK